MSTLESQYKRFIEENPDSTFTYDEWLKWFGDMLSQTLLDMEKNDKEQNNKLSNN